jgi:hypothetical protein
MALWGISGGGASARTRPLLRVPRPARSETHGHACLALVHVARTPSVLEAVSVWQIAPRHYVFAKRALRPNSCNLSLSLHSNSQLQMPQRKGESVGTENRIGSPQIPIFRAVNAPRTELRGTPVTTHDAPIYTLAAGSCGYRHAAIRSAGTGRPGRNRKLQTNTISKAANTRFSPNRQTLSDRYNLTLSMLQATGGSWCAIWVRSLGG